MISLRGDVSRYKIVEGCNSARQIPPPFYATNVVKNERSSALIARENVPGVRFVVREDNDKAYSGITAQVSVRRMEYMARGITGVEIWTLA